MSRRSQRVAMAPKPDPEPAAGPYDWMHDASDDDIRGWISMTGGSTHGIGMPIRLRIRVLSLKGGGQ